MREGSSFSWFLTDHLGSVVGVTDSNATLVSQTRYTPFGEIRSDVGTVTETDYGYTFQRNISDLGLVDYKARYCNPLLGRFTQPDTLISGGTNPQVFNRYSYVNNNPINFNDPSGHRACSDMDNNGKCVDDSWRPKTSTLNTPEREVKLPKKTSGNSLTYAEKAIKGDIASIAKVLTPTHFGVRAEANFCFGVCVSMGINLIYNSNDKKLVASADVQGGTGPSPKGQPITNPKTGAMPKFGVFASVGPLIGWESSSIEDSTKGTSAQANAFAAAGFGISVSVSSPANSELRNGEFPLYVDPVYGQVPFTVYLGLGAGVGAGLGFGLADTISRQEISTNK